MRIARWMSNATLKDRASSVELGGCLGIEGIGDVLHTGKLRWVGHMKRMVVGTYMGEETYKCNCGG